MRLRIAVLALIATTAVCLSSTAQAHVRVGVLVGIPPPLFVAPPPVVYAAPVPVVVQSVQSAPPTVYVEKTQTSPPADTWWYCPVTKNITHT
ncbi:hypothetical protein HDG38_002432 [Paraburkholderia sp. WSM4177]|nr:hypothetical protein [Paraburkholderia sp. WSM4177]MBB5485065.1 hypothetical protein [Paraburkholderia sp. WSM4180]